MGTSQPGTIEARPRLNPESGALNGVLFDRTAKAAEAFKDADKDIPRDIEALIVPACSPSPLCHGSGGS